MCVLGGGLDIRHWLGYSYVQLNSRYVLTSYLVVHIC